MDLNLLLLFGLAGLATFLIRLSFIALLGRMQVPAWVRRILPYVPTAALTAIIVPELLMRGDILFVSVSNTRLIAGLLACAVATTPLPRSTGHMPATPPRSPASTC